MTEAWLVKDEPEDDWGIVFSQPQHGMWIKIVFAVVSQGAPA